MFWLCINSFQLSNLCAWTKMDLTLHFAADTLYTSGHHWTWRKYAFLHYTRSVYSNKYLLYVEQQHPFEAYQILNHYCLASLWLENAIGLKSKVTSPKAISTSISMSSVVGAQLSCYPSITLSLSLFSIHSHPLSLFPTLSLCLPIFHLHNSALQPIDCVNS